MPDFATIGGVVRCIRSSPGYEYGFEGMSEADKNYLREQNDGGGYTITEPRADRAKRVEEAKKITRRSIITPTRERQEHIERKFNR